MANRRKTFEWTSDRFEARWQSQMNNELKMTTVVLYVACAFVYAIDSNRF